MSIIISLFVLISRGLYINVRVFSNVLTWLCVRVCAYMCALCVHTCMRAHVCVCACVCVWLGS